MEHTASGDMIETKIAQTKDGTDDYDASYLYTPLSVAQKEIRRRFDDRHLRAKVEKFFGVIPEVYRGGGNATLFRFVATPNFEYELAQNMASLVGLQFVFMEFLNDTFCTRNPDKVYLGKLAFFDDKHKRETSSGSRVKVIDLERSEGLHFKDMKTLKGEDFVDFHHHLCRLRGDMPRTFNVSQFKTNGETATEVYVKVFSLFICHGILFEDYLVDTNADERKFVQEAIAPAFEAVYKMFGVKPLIVPIANNTKDLIFWQFYHESLRSSLTTGR